MYNKVACLHSVFIITKYVLRLIDVSGAFTSLAINYLKPLNYSSFRHIEALNVNDLSVNDLLSR